jgi:Flp pilus assembly protein TadG
MLGPRKLQQTSSPRSVQRRIGRGGIAAVEMAILLPLLMFLMLVTIDFGRVFYFSLTIANCARNGALYASDAIGRQTSPYASVTEAALADASNLNDPSNPPTVSSGSGTDSSGKPFVEVTVAYRFTTLTRFPGIPTVMDLSRTVRMPVAPTS